jgi:hypothetical protein
MGRSASALGCKYSGLRVDFDEDAWAGSIQASSTTSSAPSRPHHRALAPLKRFETTPDRFTLTHSNPYVRGECCCHGALAHGMANPTLRAAMRAALRSEGRLTRIAESDQLNPYVSV